MPEKLVEILDSKLIESGVWPSVDNFKVPLWKDGMNVSFRKGQVEKSLGFAAFLTAGANVNAIEQALVSSVKRVYLGTTNALYYYPNGGSITALRTGLSTGRWSLLPWGAFLIATNDVDRVQLWQNTGSAADISDGPTRARIVRALKVFVVAFDADGTEGRFEWCDRGNPTVWTPALDNLAGGDQIRDIVSKTMCAEAFAGGLAAWSTGEMYLITYVGGTSILTYRKLEADCGAAGINAVCVKDSLAYGVEQARGFWRTEGVSVTWIAEPMIWDYYKSRIDWTKGDEITTHDDGNECIEWHFPVVGGGYEGVSFNIRTGAWAPKDWKLTAACKSETWGVPLGANGTAVYQLSSTYNKAGAAMNSWVQSKPLELGTLEFFKWVDELRMRMNGNAKLDIGLVDQPDGSVTWLTQEDLARSHYPMREAGFWIIKISSSAADVSWAWAGMEVYGQVAGPLI